MLPTAALVSMAACATGSNRGYDQMVPHHVSQLNVLVYWPHFRRIVDLFLTLDRSVGSYIMIIRC